MKIKKLSHFLNVTLLSFILVFVGNQLKLNAANSVTISSQNLHYHHGLILARTPNEDVNYLTNLGLMKGHLLVGKELLTLTEFEQSEPHFGHPVDEIYGDLEPQLTTRKVHEFKQDLTTLHELVKFSPQDKKVSSQYNLAMEKIDQAIAILPETKLNAPEFMIKVINRLLTVAKEEYGAAIIDNKIVEIIEYQDARGFVLTSEILYNRIKNNLRNQYPSLEEKLTLNLQNIKQGFPSAIAPEKAVISPQELTELVSQFKM